MNDQPNLGMATTRELLDELRARAEMDKSLEYRTVETDDERDHRVNGILFGNGTENLMGVIEPSSTNEHLFGMKTVGFVKDVSKEKLEKAQNIIDIQGSDGNWNYDPYMHGFYNGLLMLMSIFNEEEPGFRSAPDHWLCDPKGK
jgi:hypothetical protein